MTDVITNNCWLLTFLKNLFLSNLSIGAPLPNNWSLCPIRNRAWKWPLSTPSSSSTGTHAKIICETLNSLLKANLNFTCSSARTAIMNSYDTRLPTTSTRTVGRSSYDTPHSPHTQTPWTTILSTSPATSTSLGTTDPMFTSSRVVIGGTKSWRGFCERIKKCRHGWLMGSGHPLWTGSIRRWCARCAGWYSTIQTNVCVTMTNFTSTEETGMDWWIAGYPNTSFPFVIGPCHFQQHVYRKIPL